MINKINDWSENKNKLSSGTQRKDDIDWRNGGVEEIVFDT